MQTERDPIDHIEMQRGRIVGQLEYLSRARMRRRAVEQVGQGHDRDHPTPTLRARRCGRGFEVAGEGHEPDRLHGVELDPGAVVIHDGQVGHGRKLPASRAGEYGRPDALCARPGRRDHHRS